MSFHCYLCGHKISSSDYSHLCVCGHEIVVSKCYCQDDKSVANTEFKKAFVRKLIDDLSGCVSIELMEFVVERLSTVAILDVKNTKRYSIAYKDGEAYADKDGRWLLVKDVLGSTKG